MAETISLRGRPMSPEALSQKISDAKEILAKHERLAGELRESITMWEQKLAIISDPSYVPASIQRVAKKADSLSAILSSLSPEVLAEVLAKAGIKA